MIVLKPLESLSGQFLAFSHVSDEVVGILEVLNVSAIRSRRLDFIQKTRLAIEGERICYSIPQYLVDNLPLFIECLGFPVNLV